MPVSKYIFLPLSSSKDLMWQMEWKIPGQIPGLTMGGGKG